MVRKHYQLILWNALVATAYALSGYWALQLAYVNSNVTLLWPPTGIAAAALFLLGSRSAPGILLGAIGANLLNGLAPLLAVTVGVGNTAGMLVGYWMLRAAYRGPLEFSDSKFTVYYVLYPALLGGLLTALWGTATLALAGKVAISKFVEVALIWWIGDAMGVLLLGPFLISLKTLRWRWEPARLLEFLALLSLASAACYFIFLGELGFASHYPLIYLVFPFLVWAAGRFGPPGGTLLIVLISGFSTLSTARGLGPFSRESVHESILFLHTYLSLFAVTTLLLGAVLDEKRRYLEKLTSAHYRAEESNRIKGEFLANMSHEIRTPVSVIMGYIEFLKGDLDDQEREQIVQTIRRNGEHLLDLIGDILDLSRIEAGRLPLSRQWFHLEDFVREIVRSFDLKARDKGLSFYVRVNAEVGSLYGDSLRIRQVLSNLLSNAIKFTEHGSILLLVDAQKKEGVTELLFRVSDSGSGIESDQLEKIFNPFYQSEASLSRRFGGTGLGLAVCRRLADLMGGTIGVTSEKGQGSSFVLTLPLNDDEVRARISPQSPLEISHENWPEGNEGLVDDSLEPAEVLVVEDTADLQKLIGRQLESLGVHVSYAGNGQEAMSRIHERGKTLGASRPYYDVILMDIQMPIMDGYEATRKLRSMGYSGRIVALTAHAMEGERERCLKAGMDAYLSKPVNRALLEKVLFRSEE